MIKKFDTYNPFEEEYDIPDISYVDLCTIFFDKKHLQEKEDIIKEKDNLIEFLSNKKENEKLNKFKRKTLICKMNLMYLYINYYEYFENRFGKKTYRFIGKESDIDQYLIEESMEVKASDMDNLSKNYSFDGGFVKYWSFRDSIVFKTMKRLKII